MNKLIQLAGVTKKYKTRDGEVAALDGVSLEIAQGEFVAITGPSGSGKSTLLNILGLLDQPGSGEYLCAGHKTSDLDDAGLSALRGRLIGFVFQNFHALQELTAEENVALPLAYSGVSGGHDPLECLEQVELTDRRHHRPGELSGGQQQRMAIARAMVNKPRIILADEPTGNLDGGLRDEILSLFEKLNKKGITVILITHDPAVAARAHRVINIKDGRISSDDSKKSGVPAAAEPLRLPRPVRIFTLKAFKQQAGAAIACMRRNKLRSLLIFACFSLGIGAVTAVLGLTGSFRKKVYARVDAIDSRVIEVYPSVKTAKLSFEDAARISGQVPNVEGVSVSAAAWGELSAGEKKTEAAVYELNPYRLRVYYRGEVSGRLFTEEAADRDAALLMRKTALELFSSESAALGRGLNIGGKQFLVTGIIDSLDFEELKGANPERGVLIQLNAGQGCALADRTPKLLEVKINREENVAAAAGEISKLFNGAPVPGREVKKKFKVHSAKTFLDAIRRTNNFLRIFLLAVTAIPILLGGLAVANTMLLSVGERRAEIGLRKALGARRKDILAQFLMESFLLYAAGGILGAAVGAAAVYKLAALMKIEPAFSASAVLYGFALMGLSGLLFGLWPALKAANVNPIQSLRGN